jgi:hypothetical protein
VLPDAGHIKLAPSALGLQARDKSWNSFLDSFLRANGEYLKALDIELAFSAGADTVDLSLKANGIVGAVPLRAPDTHKTIGGIIVEPRFGWGSVGSIFAALGWSSAPELLSYPLVPGSAQQVPPWIIGGPVVSYLEKLLKHSLPAFREMEEVLSMPRGAIDWGQYARQQVAHGKAHLLPCRFSDLQPDRQLRSYIRWTLEKIASSLGDAINSDNAARSLWNRIAFLLSQLNDVRAQLPDRGLLDQLQRNIRGGDKAELGFSAIRWVLDERGLAGRTDLDGLSWRIVMHELFENWVEQLVRKWAKDFGGRVSCGRKLDSQSPIRWARSGLGSLSSLVPDVVVETAEDTFIFDAKYKGFLEEVDGWGGAGSWGGANSYAQATAWASTVQVQDVFREHHRHDLHQVLAYSSMYDTPRVTAALVYPTTFDTGQRLAEGGRDVSMGVLDGPGRQIRLALVAVPIGGPVQTASAAAVAPAAALSQSWGRLRGEY